MPPEAIAKLQAMKAAMVGTTEAVAPEQPKPPEFRKRHVRRPKTRLELRGEVSADFREAARRFR